MQTQIIRCDRHGPREKAIVCRHLPQPTEGGYFAVPAEAGEPAQAWCQVCEDARIADHGWYDYADSVAQWLLVCTECLARAVKKRSLIHEFAGEVTPDEKPP